MSGSLKIELRPDGVAVVVLDVAGSPVNVLSRSLVSEFGEALDRIESDPSIVAVVFASGKRDGFIAGADLDEVAAMRKSDEAEAFVRAGHDLLDRIEASRKPIVAAIHGAALGGGLEVALACHHRIATDHPKTILALPEVMLGLLPAAGGTQRLPRLIGLPRALPLLLTGQRVRARRALELGLVDELTTPESLLTEASRSALELVARRRSGSRAPITHRWITRSPLRTLLVRHARKEVAKKSGTLYPAPDEILDAVEAGLGAGRAEGRQREIEAFGRLVVSPVSRNLVWLFHQTRGGRSGERGSARPVRKLGVVGAGLMGEGIASVSLPLAAVVVRDVTPEALERARKNIDASLQKRVRSGSLGKDDAARHQGALTFSLETSALSRSDLVIEAVFEDLALKRAVLAEIESVIAPDAVFASNTSAIPIRQIAEGARHPERVVGMHYFSPVPKMPLLELVRTELSSEQAVDTARAFGAAQGKTVVVVKDGPGFFTTRILAPYLNEAVLLAAEGAAFDDVDEAMREFGFPVGPFTLLDEVGIDVAAHVSRQVGSAFEARGHRRSEILEALAADGRTGRKGGRGFYLRRKKKKRVDRDAYRYFGGGERRELPENAADRLVLSMVNEAAHALGEGIVSSPADADVAAVLGLGFPPGRGGPFHYVDALSAHEVVSRLEALARSSGARFEPAPLLREKAESGASFFG
jgi:3-hydroxyacyl-CoA dehydrogenase / enoyl-CoA hydratase / 3-hydroxybutyryl-CoA epimerase